MGIVSVQGVDQKPGFWCSMSQKLLAVERFSEANGILWQEKPGFLAGYSGRSYIGLAKTGRLIDRMVCRWYELTGEEIAVVEGST